MAVPTSRDVAKLAGVSQSTVSYVLTGKRPISEETRRRVEDAMTQLTFHPNAGARALASQRTRVVGLIAPFGASTHQQGILPFVETIASGVRAHVLHGSASPRLKVVRAPKATRSSAATRVENETWRGPSP